MTFADLIAALPEKQRDVLGLIAINQDVGHPRAVLAALEKKGLIVAHEQTIYGTGRSPIDRIPMTVKRYEVPLPVHYAWCLWCSEQPLEEPE